MRRLATCALVALLATVVLATPAGAASVANGTFETGDLSGWTTVGVEPETWIAYTGSGPNPSPVPLPPPQGRFAAITRVGVPGTRLLYQDLNLEAGSRHELSFLVYYANDGLLSDGFATPETLDFSIGSPNQQYRIDILDPAAPLDSVASDDVLLRAFRTEVGDPEVLSPTRLTIDLTPFAGSVVRLRFAEVDNQGFLSAAVDDVSVTSTPLNRPTTCVVTALRAGPPRQQDVTVQDPDGIGSISGVHVVNGTVQIPTFTPGTPAPLVLTATKTDRNKRTFWEFDVTDSNGFTKHCV